jgi:hypothetical protein
MRFVSLPFGRAYDLERCKRVDQETALQICEQKRDVEETAEQRSNRLRRQGVQSQMAVRMTGRATRRGFEKRAS